MARPLGITVLSITFGLLAFSGIGNAIVWNSSFGAARLDRGS
jgi:hypothetical protein